MYHELISKHINVSVYIIYTYTHQHKISYNMKMQQLGQQFSYTIATSEGKKKKGLMPWTGQF